MLCCCHCYSHWLLLFGRFWLLFRTNEWFGVKVEWDSKWQQKKKTKSGNKLKHLQSKSIFFCFVPHTTLAVSQLTQHLSILPFVFFVFFFFFFSSQIILYFIFSSVSLSTQPQITKQLILSSVRSTARFSEFSLDPNVWRSCYTIDNIEFEFFIWISNE